MNFALAFHAGDKDQAARWLAWVEELGGMGEHKLWIMPARGQKADFKTGIPFTVVEDQYGIQTDWASHNGPVRDASGPNSMVRQFAWHFFMQKLGPWMFIEPDAIPLRPGWHDALRDEYNLNRKYFMGAFVKGIEGQYPDHSTGNMVFPEDALSRSKLLMLPTTAIVEATGQRVELAFDVAAAPEILSPSFHATKLIQHVFRGPRFETMTDLLRIAPETVIFHTDKDGGLIKLLRQKKNGVAEGLNADTRKIGAGVVNSGSEIPAEIKSLTVPTVGSNPTPITKPRVHTYFRPCVDTEALAEQKRILALWEKNWSEHGWEPVIITENDARKHPQFAKYEAAFRAMPTVSSKEYEMACWLRWVAMSQIGGLMVDYDVLCQTDLIIYPGIENTFPIILSDNNPVPCAVSGRKEQYECAITAFLSCPDGSEQGKPHLSDQIAVQQLGFPAIGICKEVGTPGWREAKLIHFSHAACGQKRSEDMRLWMSEPITQLPESIRPTGSTISVMDEIREKLLWVKENSPGITRHHVHLELKKLGLLPKKK